VLTVSDVTFSWRTAGHPHAVKQRTEWIDLVKATSVLLVVFMHASNTLVGIGGRSAVTSALASFNQLIEPMRMPIFFLVSGMLAASAIRRPWRASTNRTTGMLYLYLTWMLLFWGFISLFGADITGPISAILFAKTGYWYLYALLLFFVIARLLRNQPAWLVVAAAVVPNLVRPLTQEFFSAVAPGTLLTSIAMNLSFFLFGAYFTQFVGSVAAKATMAHTVALGVLATAAGILWMNTPSTAGQSYFVLSVAWVAFGVAVAVQITRNGAPAWSRYVGTRTLPIYVLQWPLLFVAARYVPEAAVGNPVSQVLFPIAFTACVAALALWLHSLPALRPLFKAPSWATEPVHLPEQLRRRVRTEPTVAVPQAR
jgi:surface polysaccharide O-acyltransferase-like enzyme